METPLRVPRIQMFAWLAVNRDATVSLQMRRQMFAWLAVNSDATVSLQMRRGSTLLLALMSMCGRSRKLVRKKHLQASKQVN